MKAGVMKVIIKRRKKNELWGGGWESLWGMLLWAWQFSLWK